MPASPQIVQGGHLVTPVLYPIANATAVDYGDFLKISAGNVTPLTASTDNETFVGQAIEAKVASDGKTQIMVCPPTPGVVWEAELDTGTTIAIGDKLAWSADRVLTKTATDSLAVVVRPGTSQTAARYELLRLAASAIKNLPGGTLMGDGFDLDEIGLGDDEDLLFGTGEDFGLRWSTGDASNHAAVLFLDNTNQALHVTDKGAVATDWNISAIADPAIFLHSNTTPATDYLKIGAHDGTTAELDVVGGTTLAFKVAGTAQGNLTAGGFDVIDDNSFVVGTGLDAEFLWSTGDADNHAAVLALGNSSQALHITDVGAKATDWNVAADTHPNLYIHSNTTPATDYLRIGDHDGTEADIDVVGGTSLAFKIAGTEYASVRVTGLAAGTYVAAATPGTDQLTLKATGTAPSGTGANVGHLYADFETDDDELFWLSGTVGTATQLTT